MIEVNFLKQEPIQRRVRINLSAILRLVKNQKMKARERPTPPWLCLIFSLNIQVIWWRNSEDWDEKFYRRIPQPRAALFFEFNMAEARLELVGSTWMFIQ